MGTLKPGRGLLLGLVAVVIAAACGAPGASNPSPEASVHGGTVSVLGVWSDGELDSFNAVLAPFTAQTGITVNYDTSRDQDAILTTRVTAGNPPDLAAAPSPSLLTRFANQGKVINLENIMNMTQIKSDGTTPWCMAVESGAASGWAGSDFHKEIALSTVGPATYDSWWQGKTKWTSPAIKSTWTTFGQILGSGDSNVYGGANYVINTNFGDVGTPMFQNPPKCDMLNQASFITSFFTKANPSLVAGTDFNFFRLLPDKARPSVRPWIWVGPALIIVAAFLVGPAIGTVIQSFENHAGNWVGLTNYQRQLADF